MEIKLRLEKYLEIKLNRRGRSNHFIGEFNGVSICISNFDAWVHVMLQQTLSYDELQSIGASFNHKVTLLLEKTASEHLKCLMKTRDEVGLLLLDEAQDLLSKKMKIIVNLAQKNNNLDVNIAGDYLQTLFSEKSNLGPDEEKENLGDAHAMNVFKRLKTYEYFNLNKCFRCPKAHVDFNNLIMKDIQKKYDIPPMESSSQDTINKPFIFTHLPASENTTARRNAEQITIMIRILMQHDSSIIPDDIAVIMFKSKGNEIFNQLENTLDELFKAMGKGENKVTYMSTAGDGRHRTLDWEFAKGKTKLLSIHGDKGKGHKVVFFLGLTENSIPREECIFKPTEIIAESLLNVGITRSTQYLFIGFTHSYPSRYLHHVNNELNQYAYLSWDTTLGEHVDEPYHSILEQMDKSLLPKWNVNYKNEKLNIGTKSVLEVRDDLSKAFEQASDFIDQKWNKNVRVKNFGQEQKYKLTLKKKTALFWVIKILNLKLRSV